MKLTGFAIKNNRITIIALFIIIIGGFTAYTRLPRDYDPGFIVRTAQVLTYFPGASPERVEQLVTDKLEEVIQEIPELKSVESTSKTGISIIMVNIEDKYTGMRPIWDSLRRKVNDKKGELPSEIIGPIVNDEFGDVFGIVLSITGEGFSYAEMKEVADEMRNRILLIDEVAKVNIYGVQEERVFVEYNNARLAELGISPYQLMNILESRNIIISGGDITIGRERIVLEPSGNFQSVADLKNTVIHPPRTNEVIYLGDIVDIFRGYIDPPRSKMRATGKPALGLAISMKKDGNLIELGKKVKPLIAELQNQYPYGLDFHFINFQPHDVNKKVIEFRNNLLQAIGVVIAVMLITLGIRTGLLVGTLIPMTILMALLIMYYTDIGLDQVSLASLVIALGMLVDNAIVMTESIMVQISEGKKRVTAAVDSARELALPLVISSLTTAAAFLPIFLAESDTGEYTAPIFKVVAITLLSSWVLAMTMIPLFCTRFLKAKPEKVDATYDTRFYRLYRKGLLSLLKHRFLTIAVTLLVFAGGIYSFKFLPVIFFPPSDREYLKAEFEYPQGTSIEATEEMVKEIERFLIDELLVNEKRKHGITSWAAYIGESGPRFILQHKPEPGNPNYALLVINITSQEYLDRIKKRIEDYVFVRFPSVVANVKKIENGPPIEHPVEIEISGQNTDVLFDIVEKTKEKLRSVEGTKNVIDDWGLKTKKLRVKIDQARAQRAGVASRDIALSLQAGLSGFTLTEYREEDEIIPVMLRTVVADRKDIGKLESLNVYVQKSGKSVPLRQVADIEVQWQYPKIERKNRLRTVTVSSDLMNGVTADRIISEVVPWLEKEKQDWETGYRYELGGEAETSAEANQSIMVQLPVAGFIIIFLLVSQFNSIRKPFIILVTIPLGFVGVIIGLFVTNLYFGFMTLLGMISLAGIVINNAIVLLDRIRIEMEENGHDEPRAVIEAGQRRFRPILLTTATTAFGMLPLYISGGAMWEPMAIAIIAGLLFSTLLTLGIVPVLYSLFFRVSFKNFQY